MTSSRAPQDDIYWMQLALQAADQAVEAGEVPVGAVIVLHGRLLAISGNCPITMHDPTAHAEIMAIRAAAQTIRNYRLPGATLYVTLEPCLMCIGAIIHARIDRLVYGATDPKGGAVESLYKVANDNRLNHRLAVTSGVLREECSERLRTFFQKKRDDAAALKAINP